jgi:uncharacterized protein (TIGR01244 family)
MHLLLRVLPLAFALLLLTSGAHAQSPQGAIDGIDKFHRVTTTIACGSNAGPDTMAGLREAGFRSVISFREDGERGYDRPAVEAAAMAAGLRFVSIPVNSADPDPAAADRFLALIVAPGTEPAFIFCGSGERPAAMWLIKRVKQDGWTPQRALTEAEGIGLTRPSLKQFALTYVGAAAMP